MDRIKKSNDPWYRYKCHYQVSDFSIILRENKRYAEAGFPTKFVESIACGVPVIANKVGDIQKYITEYEVGFLIDNDNIFNNLSSIISSYSVSQLSKEKMKKKCFLLAKERFMFDSYTECLNKVI